MPVPEKKPVTPPAATPVVPAAKPEPTPESLALLKTVEQLTAAVTELKQEREASKSQANKDAEAERLAALNADKDIKSMIDSLTAESHQNVDDKFENMSKKQLVDTLVTAIEAKDAAQQQLIAEAIQASQKVNDPKLEAITNGLMAVMAKLSVNETKSQFPDFDQHKEAVGKVLQQYPSMSVADAYLLAKSRKAGDMPPVSEMDTEKGQEVDLRVIKPRAGLPRMTEEDLARVAERGQESRSTREVEAARARGRGVVNFRSLVEAAADKVVQDGK